MMTKSKLENEADDISFSIDGQSSCSHFSLKKKEKRRGEEKMKSMRIIRLPRRRSMTDGQS